MIARFEQTPRADDLCEDAAALNIGDKQPFAVEMMHGPQIDNVARHQIELHRTARALQNQHVALFLPMLQSLANHQPELLDQPVIFGGFHVPSRTAEHH